MEDLFNIDPELMKKEQEAAMKEKESLLGWGAIADNLSNRTSFGDVFLGRTPKRNNVSKEYFGGLASGQDEKLKRSKDILDQYRQHKLKEQDVSRDREWQKTLSDYQNQARAKQDAVSDKRDFERQMQLARFNKGADMEKYAAESQIKRDEKEFSLQTPYGLANTLDDAKQLKQAHEAKQGFDSKVKEMIGLREKHGGGALFNRDDVGRGKQLSKDLLLAYKDMAKLGVLSQSDEKILNAIIPDDPLAYDLVPGQDPILHKMKKFQEDSDKDFSTRVATRTRQGGEGQRMNAQSPKPLTQEDNKALSWAKNNPSDPRAAAIFQANGINPDQMKAR